MVGTTTYVTRNAAALRYSHEHRQAITYVAEKLFFEDPYYEDLARRIRYHDLDKMYLYTLVDKQSASRYHRATSSHHTENDMAMSYVDQLEAICDWECAAYTKPDKPDNAYDAMQRLHPKGMNQLIEIMSIYDMDASYEVSGEEDEWLAWKREHGISSQRCAGGDGEPDGVEAEIEAEIEMLRRECPQKAAQIEAAAQKINKGSGEAVEAAMQDPRVAAYMSLF